MHIESAGKEIVAHRELNEIHLSTLESPYVSNPTHEERVVAVGVVTDNEHSGIDPGPGWHIQGLHVRHHAGIDLADHIRLDAGDVVHLHHINRDLVTLGPLLDNAMVLGVVPRHPASIDADRQREFVPGEPQVRERRDGEPDDHEYGNQRTALGHSLSSLSVVLSA